MITYYNAHYFTIGCCEKGELIIRVIRLYNEHKKNVELAIKIDQNDKNMRGYCIMLTWSLCNMII